MLPEDEAGEHRYISPRAMNEVRKRLVILDQLEVQMSDVRSAMLHLIADDTDIDIVGESWAIDLDHGCVIKQEVSKDAGPDAE